MSLRLILRGLTQLDNTFCEMLTGSSTAGAGEDDGPPSAKLYSVIRARFAAGSAMALAVCCVGRYSTDAVTTEFKIDRSRSKDRSLRVHRGSGLSCHLVDRDQFRGQS